MNQNNQKSVVFLAATVVMGCGCAWADDIYNDVAGYNGYGLYMANNQEIGNEITITQGNAWSLDQFQIQYYSSDLSTDVGVDIRFYLNNGPLSSDGYPSPGSSPFFDSGFISPAPTGGSSHTLTLDSGDLYSDALVPLASGSTLPGDFTFTVTFENLDSPNSTQVLLAGNQTTSSSQNYGDYWLNNGNGTWSLETNSVGGTYVPANFVVDMTGTVPEPSTIGLAALGGAMLLGARLRRKR